MSKLSEAIRRTMRIESTPMGFGAARVTAKATMLVGHIAGDAAAVEQSREAGAEVVLVRLGNKEITSGEATKVPPASGQAVVGMWGKVNVTTDLHKNGVDFLVLDAEATPAAAMLNEELGYVLLVPKEPEELFLRSLEPLSLDGLLLSEVPSPLTVAQQVEMMRIGTLARKPLFCSVKADVSKEELQCLRSAGVVLVLVEGNASGISQLKETAMALPPRRQRREERPVVSLPRGQAPVENDDDDDEDD